MPDREKIMDRIYDAIDYGVCVDLFMDILDLLKEQERIAIMTEETENICHKRNARIFACKECGYGINDIYLTDESNYQIEPVFCPNCGRKVV